MFPFDRGRYSQIWLVKEVRTSKLFAAKVFQKLEIQKKMTKNRFMWELRIHSRISHPSFPNFRGSSQNKHEFVIYMDYVDGPNFYQFEKNLPDLTNSQGAFYVAQVVLMIEHLHKNQILYRDLKPENILVDKNGYLKLIDFGCAKQLDRRTDRTFTICGTPDFQAPEIVLGVGHGLAVDYWALGVFIFELFAAENPFFDENPMKFYRNTIKGGFRFPKYFPSQAKKVIKNLLHLNPTKRIEFVSEDFKGIKEDLFFSDLNWGNLSQKKLVSPFLPQTQKRVQQKPYNSYKKDGVNSLGELSLETYKDW